MKEQETIDWYAYEQQAAQEGRQCVCGVDEAGRGPLAGPVFAAAVILPQGLVIDGLNDSKKLTEKKRETLFPVIQEEAAAWSVASASVEEIEQYNILGATFLAMCRAVDGLSLKADFALIDGNRVPAGLSVPCRTIVKGDSHSASIAAASILAKVSRDHLMLELDREYPQYQFAKHKGYGTKLHRELILEHGPSPIHRPCFLRKLLGNA